MIRLSREIRFALSKPSSHEKNSWAAWPSSNAIVPFLILRCSIQGQPDSRTGYVCNIKLLDDLLREIVLEQLIPKYESDMDLNAESMTQLVFDEATTRWEHPARLTNIELVVSPYLKYSINQVRSDMICLTQQFEFSAAHRLHCDEMSAEENVATFGKCNNLEGHGHNYVVEVTVENESNQPQVISLSDLERTVKRLVIDRLDHKHLNRDVDYFKSVIPSVENIAIAIWNWLENQIPEASSARLNCVRVYETPKTWAEYRG